MPVYRFSGFELSPRRRSLVRDGREIALIPRYFDLLVLLVERRHEAVHRREIFDRVWGDVIVSDTALNQAIRTIRRTLDDDPREPRFIRTVARHGYRFVYADVVETDHERVDEVAAPARAQIEEVDEIEALLARVTQRARTEAEEEDRREAAELLHAAGTAEALRRLGTREGHARARALLRDTRWDAPDAAQVPVLGAPDALSVAREVVALRLRRAARLVARRWAGASIGGGLAGAFGGALGGLLLAILPGSTSPLALVPVLAAIGGGCGAAAGAGVGAGLAVAEATARSARITALIVGAALGGGVIGAAVQWLGRWTLAALVGLRIDIGGGVEGLAIGAAAGLGFALATRRVEGGLAAPRGWRRLTVATATGVLCGLAAALLTMVERPMVGGTLHLIARAAQGSQVSLEPFGRLIGEPDFGPISRMLLAFGEAGLFGLGLTLGLTRR